VPPQDDLDGVLNGEPPPASLGRREDVLVVAQRHVDGVGPDALGVYFIDEEHHAVVDLWAVRGQAGPREGKIHPDSKDRSLEEAPPPKKRLKEQNGTHKETNFKEVAYFKHK
jgi:hypothetical protein